MKLKKKDILMIAHFCSDFDREGNNRFNYLADLLSKHGHNVELVTSDFSHERKEKRNVVNLNRLNYKVTFIKEPKYKKNVSLKRFYSHYVMGKNLKRYLSSRKKPDIIYSAVPSLDAAKIAANFANKNNIKYIIDVQDLWPEAFKMVFKVPLFDKILFYPMKKIANYIYSTADEIIAVSDTYRDRAMISNKKVKKGYSVYLGTNLEQFDAIPKNNEFNNKKDKIWLVYVGTLGNSYDIPRVIDALKIVQKKGIKNIEFIVMGDGPLKEKFKRYAKDKGVNVQFTGRLPYSKMVSILKKCDIAVNPIKKGSAGSIINKVCDYAAAGLPVINTQESLEYRQLINEYNAGYNCNNVNELADKILILCKDEKLRRKMGNNNRRLAEEKLDRKKTYQQILKLIND